MAVGTANAIEFLMEGDPAIRWQTMRDLLDEPSEVWSAERQRMSDEGWGPQFLAARAEDGSWPNERWTGTVWTLVILSEIGYPVYGDCFANSFENVVGRLMPAGSPIDPVSLKTKMDLCHLGFWIRIGAYFLESDPRLKPLAELILSMQLEDGGWNCRVRAKPNTCHSSFHTTFNILEGLREAALHGIVSDSTFKEAEARAIEFMLQHRMYRSDRTGEIVSERFLDLTYPSYWHYNVLRGLDYIAGTPFIRDPRCDDALSYLESRRKPNGLWLVEKRIPGVTLFEMEKMGKESRWNTLRALRVLRAAGRST